MPYLLDAIETLLRDGGLRGHLPKVRTMGSTVTRD